MEIVIDIDESVPGFVRRWIGTEVAALVEQIRAAVRRGDLRPGDALPSIRQLAADLELDDAVVARAYRLLESAAVIERKGYRGSFVCADAAARANAEH